ncbi:MAG: helix-turn-helix domain-containing protein [Nitrososphaerales archaeon]|nr:helix-turn-helix domain-containing protein [Nitrososphaerales archaeon]
MLGHPLRRKIIRYLGEHESGSFTNLKSYLNVSTGTLYYQLDLLKNLIEQNEERKYYLNEKGKFAYKLLLESSEKLTSSRFIKRSSTIKGYITLWLIGWKLISHLYGIPKLAILIALIILLYGAWITNISGLYPIVFIYMERLPIPQSYIPLLFISGYLLVNILANLTSYILYRTLEGVKYLFLGTAFSLTPTFILPTLYVIAKGLQAPLTSIQAQILMLIGMGYFFSFFTSAISLSKGLVFEKAALSASFTLYFCIGLTFILNSL